jgi:hypothetical protein
MKKTLIKQWKVLQQRSNDSSISTEWQEDSDYQKSLS